MRGEGGTSGQKLVRFLRSTTTFLQDRTNQGQSVLNQMTKTYWDFLTFDKEIEG